LSPKHVMVPETSNGPQIPLSLNLLEFINVFISITKCRSRVRDRVLYAESPYFTQQSTVRLHWTCSFLIFLSVSKKNSEQCLKLGYPFSCTSFKPIIQWSVIATSLYVTREITVLCNLHGIKNMNTGITLVRNSITKKQSTQNHEI
jgi:hypothetical protein